MRELEALGMPAFLIVPSAIHRIDAHPWKERYPQIVVIAPAGARDKISEVVAIDATAAELGDPRVRIDVVPGTDRRELAMTVETGTGQDMKKTLIVNDLIFNLPRIPGFAGWGLRLLGIAMDIFRGRYRDSFEHPTAIPANTVQRYRFALPSSDHVFLPGHRVMVQIQSSWFPLYDRNPQTFVDNIFFAKASDYQKATHRVYHQPGAASAIVLPAS